MHTFSDVPIKISCTRKVVEGTERQGIDRYQYRKYCAAIRFYSTKTSMNDIQRTSFAKIYGVPGGIRTHGLSLRRRTLYPAELRRHINSIIADLYIIS